MKYIKLFENEEDDLDRFHNLVKLSDILKEEEIYLVYGKLLENDNDYTHITSGTFEKCADYYENNKNTIRKFAYGDVIIVKKSFKKELISSADIEAFIDAKKYNL